MGVLDDAIRDHLELKRKHGASDEELEREEAEALGPARRDFEPAAEQASEDEEAGFEADEPLAEERVAEERVAEERVADDPLAEEPLRDEPPAGEPLEEDALEAEPLEGGPLDERPRDEDPLSEGPLEEALPDAEPPEAEPRKDGPQGFVDETAEHERLWSEQRPRRDFDFD